MDQKIEISKKLFQEGIQFYKAQKYKNAIAKWEQVLQYYPTHAQTRQWIERARNEIAKQISIQELLNRTREHLSQDRFEEAIEELQHILDIEPDHSEAETLLTETRARLEMSRTTPPETPEPFFEEPGKKKEEAEDEKLLKEGLSLMYTRDYYPAMKKFLRVLTLNPQHTEALLYVDTLKGTLESEGILDQWAEDCEMYLLDNRLDEAREMLDVIVMCQPNNAKAHQMLNSILRKETAGESESVETQVKMLMTRSLQLYENGNNQAAIDLWEEILKIDPENPQAAKYIETAQSELERKSSDQRVNELFKDAIRLHQEGEIQRSLTKIEKALRINPAHAGAVKMKREILSSMNRKPVSITEQEPPGLPYDRRDSTFKKIAVTAAAVIVLAIIIIGGYLGLQFYKNRKSVSKLEQGLQMLKSGDDKDGVALIREAILIDDSNIAAYRALVDYYYSTENYTRASEQLLEIKRRDRATKDDLLKLCQSLINTKNFSIAQREYNELLQLYPDTMEAHKGLGKIFIEIKKFDKATEHLKKARALDPADPYNILYLGDALRENNRIAEAVVVYSEGINMDKNFIDYYLHLGELYYQDNKLDKAIETLTTPLLWDPREPRLHYSLGNIYKAEKNYPRAIESYTMSIGSLADSDPILHQIYFKRALTYLEMATGQNRPQRETDELLSKAQMDMQKAKELAPDKYTFSEQYASYFFYMGEIYWHSSLIEKAKVEYRLAIKQKSDYYEAYTALGKLFYRYRDKDNAVLNLKKSLEINPDQPHVKELLRSLGY